MALKVQVVEVQRSVVKQLGINLKGVFLDGAAATGLFGVGTNLTGPLGTIASGVGGSPITFPYNSATTPATVGMGYHRKATIRCRRRCRRSSRRACCARSPSRR